MKKVFAEVFLVLFFFIFLGNVSASEWYVCFGSFDEKEAADSRVNALEKKEFSSLVYEYDLANGQKTYRVFFSEKFTSKKIADLHRKWLSELPELKEIVGDSLWVSEVVQISEDEYHKNEEKVSANIEKPHSFEEEDINPEIPPRTIIIKDSDTGKPVSDADVNIDQKWNVRTSEKGEAPLPSEVGDGEHTLVVKKGDEYVPTSGTFLISGGEIVTAAQISIPKAVDYHRIKIVLDWGEFPFDLDSHVLCGARHVCFYNPVSGNMDLDRDDTTSYGPETITIVDPAPDEVYEYYVFNYSDDGYYNSRRLSNSGATVSVFFDNEYKGSFFVKRDQAGLWWHVFDIINEKEIVIQDKVFSFR